MGINVNINRHGTSKIYSTRTLISGNVSICPERDIPFHRLQIALVGTSHTQINMLPVAKVMDKDVLTLDMPIDKDLYPSDRVFRAGKTYQIPFHFTISSTHFKDVCDNFSDSGHIQGPRLRLHPRMGIREKNDTSRVMTRVEYAVVARVFKANTSGLGQMIEVSQSIRVSPGFSEDPAMRINGPDTRYYLHKTMFMRKSLLSREKA